MLATVFRPLVGEDTPIGRFMHWYWATNFLTRGVRPDWPRNDRRTDLGCVHQHVPRADAAFRGTTTLLLGTLIVGIVALVMARRVAAALLLADVPWARAVALASVTHDSTRLAERLVLFAAPLTALLLASSLTLVYHRRASRGT